MSSSIKGGYILPDSGFSVYEWANNIGDTGKVITHLNDYVQTHLHNHKDGLTLSKYVNGKAVERYNFNTGQQEKG